MCKPSPVCQLQHALVYKQRVVIAVAVEVDVVQRKIRRIHKVAGPQKKVWLSDKSALNTSMKMYWIPCSV
jgi:hypothetical protein